MKLKFACLLLFLRASVWAQSHDYPIQAVSFTKVALTDQFWLPKIEINRTVTIPASFERCRQTGRIDNFIKAATHKGKFGTTFPFDDTDIYKTLEGASYSLMVHPDKVMEAYLDSLIAIIGAAQEPDGYLYTARTIDPAHAHSWAGTERWQKERELSHELYNAGHLYEAAAAHYNATGKRNLLNIALKNADLVCSVFGPSGKRVAPGHEIVEMGLVKLYRITGKIKYLQTAKFFLDARGSYQGYDAKSKDQWRNGSYWQDDKPVVDQFEAEGHAVRAMYLYSAMTDIAALTGDTAYRTAIDSLWNNVVSKKMYVQGGIGAIGNGESFGANYELPNATAYNETCAAVGDVYWNQRMFLLHGESRYVDILEKILYNGLISGVGLDGKSFFYTNAMQVHEDGKYPDLENARSGWFECSCCPTNLARFLPSLPGYIYAQQQSSVYINLFISGTATLQVNNKKLTLRQENNYPWEGDLKFFIDPVSPMQFPLRIRIPGWAGGHAMPTALYDFINPDNSPVVITVNGKAVSYSSGNGYAVLDRNWKKGDVVEMSLPMPVQRIHANALLNEDHGRVALQSGPIIYCAEAIDNDRQTSTILVLPTAVFSKTYRKDLLNGVSVLEAELPAVHVVSDGESVTTTKQHFMAIPYYAWANRGKGEMDLWFPEKMKHVELVTK